MATSIWDQEIGKHVDWGGDNSTGGAPVSGKYVQKFIKDTLAKKFGYLHYDKANLKYWVFADEEDFNTYMNDTTGAYSNLRLATFDAPAPATITVSDTSAQQVTALLGSTGNRLRFVYIVSDSSSNPVRESVQVRYAFNRAGEIQTLTRTIPVDYENYQTGTTVEQNIDSYLTADGTYNITVTLTGTTTQATTTLSFTYNVVQLTLTCTGYDNLKPVDFQAESFSLPWNIQGAAGSAKVLEIFIDGEPLYQDSIGHDDAISNNAVVGTKSPVNDTSIIYLKDSEGNSVTWPETGVWPNGVEMLNPSLAGREIFSSGKHSIQLRASIQGNTVTERIYSLTKYYDFVVTAPVSLTERQTYILYSADLQAGSLFDIDSNVQFNANQYESTSFNIGLYDSAGRTTSVFYELTKREDGEVKIIDSLTHSVKSESEDTFLYNFLTYGDITLTISNEFSSDVMVVDIAVAKSDASAEETTNQMLVKYTALNRSNSEPNPATWIPTGATGRALPQYAATFNKVLWNTQSGWDGRALVLKNGATVTFPIDLFAQFTSTGLTFEFELETSDVQNDNAVVMDYSDPGYNSFMKVTATSATMNTNGKATLTTNFKDNERIKIAFVFNPLYAVDDTGSVDTDAIGLPNPNMLFIIVNGVLDRVCKWGDGVNTNSDTIGWVNPTGHNVTVDADGNKQVSFTIGNTTGEATVKLYGIRVYRKALIPEEEFMNYMADSPNLLQVYNDNNVLVDGEISFDLVRQMIPTMLMSLDYVAINSASNKKTNITCDVQFYDPTDETRNFYVRNAWLSCQGTSSMQYPTKNLRLYLNKDNNDKTIQDCTKVDPTYETEFWPYGYYSDDTDFDTILPYSCNSKIDKSGYHKVGAGLSHTRAAAIAANYANLGEQLYRKTSDGFVFAELEDFQNVDDFYISAYRPIRRTINGALESEDDYWDNVKKLRYAGVKLYKKVENHDEEGNLIDITFEEVKKKKALKKGEEYYGLGSFWKQYQGSGYTDRWTLKADYAESSMAHNAGTGRLWGAAMKNVQVNGEYVCRTEAQKNAALIDGFFDIRTSCDGKPIVLFVKQVQPELNEDGSRVYSTARYAGLFNIMTDKSSTKLFGFEDLYDEKGNKVVDASHTECWEYLSNGSLLAQGLSTQFDSDKSQTTGSDIGDGRPIFESWEARWPESGQERHEGDPNFPDDVYGVTTNTFESFWNWVAFTKSAVIYDVDGHDGYDLNKYVAFEDVYAAQDYYNQYVAAVEANDEAGMDKYAVYTWYDNSGNDAYAKVEIGDFNINSGETYYFLSDIDMENVTKTINPNKIGVDVYVGQVAGFDAQYRFIDSTGYVDEDAAGDYYVDVYLRRQNNRFYYTDSFGQERQYVGSIDANEDYLKNSKGASWKNSTMMEFFSETKYEHLDVYKVAAYFIYIMRFLGADQVVKNSMQMTEDGKHYFFINYDNDTILGVRNDGHLVFGWDTDRNTYDADGNSYALAGAKSVLWNNLEMDEDFMNIVVSIDQQMYAQGLLSTEAVLDMYNTKQEEVWNERLYNEQERIKYLSTFLKNVETDKFLSFMHGTRHSHRVWFVNHRWDLFDAKWSTGAYLDKKVKYYLIVSTATERNPIRFLRVVAASKYYFTNQKNNEISGQVSPGHEWYCELAAGEEHTFDTTTSIAIGDPMLVVGPQKMRTLDFRPGITYLSATLSLCETYDVTRSDGTQESTNWVKEGGTMMQQLLIGDGVNRCPVTNISGLNFITSLEEVDIRNCNQLVSTPTIASLINLHRYRASGSNTTTFGPAQGVTLYEVSLPQSLISIALNTATFAAGPEDFSDSTVSYTASANEYTEEAKFDYKPTSTLASVSFIDVDGFNTQKFVQDWLNVLNEDGVSPSNCTLHLEGINWEGITIPELMDIYESFNIEMFTGHVTLVGEEAGGRLSEAEYAEILEVFGSNVFQSDNALVFNASENMFVTCQDINGNDITPKVDTEGTMFEENHKYFSLVRGKSLVFDATIFPIDDTRRTEYILYYKNTSNAWVAATADGEAGSRTYTTSLYGYTLANREGRAILTTTSDDLRTNPLIRIGIYELDADGRVTSRSTNYTTQFQDADGNNMYQYVEVVNQVLPEEYTVVGDTTIKKDGEEYEYSINFGEVANDINVAVNLLTVSLSESSNVYANALATVLRDSITIDNESKRYTFKVKYNVQAIDTDCPLFVTVGFDTDKASWQRMPVSVTTTIKAIYANKVILVAADDETNTPIENLFLNDVGEFKYRLVVTPEDYDVEIASTTVSWDSLTGPDHTTISDDSLEGFTLTVTDAKQNGQFVSFNDVDTINFTLVPKYNADLRTVTLSVPYKAAIVYPEKVELHRTDFKAGTTTYTNDADIYLLSNQGTYGTGSFNRIETLDYKIKVLPRNAANDYVTEDYVTYVDRDNVTIEYIDDIHVASFDTNTGVQIAAGAWYNDNSDTLSMEYDGKTYTHTDGFALALEARVETSTVRVTVPGFVTFDHDRDSTTDDVKLTFELSFLIDRSYASATSTDELIPGTFYIVDRFGRFYTHNTKVNEDGDVVIDTTDPTTDGVNMAKDQGLRDDDFIGVAWVVTTLDGGGNIVPIMDHWGKTIVQCLYRDGLNGKYEGRDKIKVPYYFDNSIALANLPIATIGLSTETNPDRRPLDYDIMGTGDASGYEYTKFLYDNFVAPSGVNVSAANRETLVYRAWNIMRTYTEQYHKDGYKSGMVGYIGAVTRGSQEILRNIVTINEFLASIGGETVDLNEIHSVFNTDPAIWSSNLASSNTDRPAAKVGTYNMSADVISMSSLYMNTEAIGRVFIKLS